MTDDQQRIRDLEYAVKHLEGYKAYLNFWQPAFVAQCEARLVRMGIADRVARALRETPTAMPL